MDAFKNKCEVFQAFLLLPQSFTVQDFDAFISDQLERKAVKEAAINDIDKDLALVSNFILLLSLHLKQRYILNTLSVKDTAGFQKFYTKKEIARLYNVSERTVTNWINDGLTITELGGVIRINMKDIEKFAIKKRSKKFNWKSIKKAA